MGVYIDNGKTITGCNIKLTFNVDGKDREIANISALSTSTEQDTKIMNFIGQEGIGALGKGVKISQGSMVYEVLDKSFIEELGEGDSVIDLSDSLNVKITHTEEETGILSTKEIKGIRFFSEGTAIGIDSLLIQEAVRFFAKSITGFKKEKN